MEYEQIIRIQRRRKLFALYLLKKYKRTRTERKIWVRRIYTAHNRKLKGVHDTLIAEMRLSDPERHFNYLRMSACQFDELLHLVGPKISRVYHNREPICASTRLALTLR